MTLSWSPAGLRFLTCWMRTGECGSRILEWIASLAERDDPAQSRGLSLGLDAGLDNLPQPSLHLNAVRGAQAVSNRGRNYTDGELMVALFELGSQKGSRRAPQPRANGRSAGRGAVGAARRRHRSTRSPALRRPPARRGAGRRPAPSARRATRAAAWG